MNTTILPPLTPASPNRRQLVLLPSRLKPATRGIKKKEESSLFASKDPRFFFVLDDLLNGAGSSVYALVLSIDGIERSRDLKMSDDPDLGFLGVALPLPYRIGLILVAGMSPTWAGTLKP